MLPDARSLDDLDAPDEMTARRLLALLTSVEVSGDARAA